MLSEQLLLFLKNGRVATGGTNTTLDDAGVIWVVNSLAGLPLKIIHAGGVEYNTVITSNTVNQLTFPALPVGILVTAGDAYFFPLPVDISPGAKTATTILNEANIALGETTALVDCAALDLTAGPATLALTVKARYGVAATQGIRVHVVSSPTNLATGTHPGVISLLVMTDLTAHFIVNELIGLTIVNVTDGSSGVVTANTETTVTCAAGLVGGVTNQWNPGDAYSIAGADFDTEDWDVWTPAFVANTVLRQTKVYETDPLFVKVLIENLDPAVAVTDVLVIAGV